MQKKIIYTPNAPKPIGPYSQAVEVNGTVYMSGQVGIDPASGKMVEGGVEAEAVQVMKNITAVLEAAGAGFDNVIKTTIFLTTMDDFGKVNPIYARYFDSDFPARETVAVKELPAGALVEIGMIVVK